MHQKEISPLKPWQGQAVHGFRQKETAALERACLYSLPPNILGYCGPGQSWRAFQEFLSKPTEQNAVAAKKKLVQFNALFSYLELIAKANGRKPFDAEVIEAYWIGNKLLESVSSEETKKTILSFQKFGLPKSIAKKKAAALPQGMLPHHSMHVLYINFVTPKVAPIVKNLSQCLIQWARVKALSPKGVKVKGMELFAESGQLKLREKEKTMQNPFGLQLKERDLITVHWGNPIELVSKECQKRLESYTLKNMETINSLAGSKEWLEKRRQAWNT